MCCSADGSADVASGTKALVACFAAPLVCVLRGCTPPICCRSKPSIIDVTPSSDKPSWCLRIRPRVSQADQSINTYGMQPAMVASTHDVIYGILVGVAAASVHVCWVINQNPKFYMLMISAKLHQQIWSGTDLRAS